MPLCQCHHCLEEVPDGKSVSRSTFHRHAKKYSLNSTTHFFRICHCHLHPTGHCFQSRSAYFQHRAIVRSSLFTTDGEILQNVSSPSVPESMDHDCSSTTSPSLMSESDVYSCEDHTRKNGAETLDQDNELIEDEIPNVNSDHDDSIMHAAWDGVDSSESSDIDGSGMSLFYLVTVRQSELSVWIVSLDRQSGSSVWIVQSGRFDQYWRNPCWVVCPVVLSHDPLRADLFM